MLETKSAIQSVSRVELQGANPTVILVDAKNISIAGWSVHKDMETSSGLASGLIYGALKTYGSLAKKYPAGVQVWCWDSVEPNWRNKECKEYKAEREPWSNEKRSQFTSQVNALRVILRELGAASITVPGTEADDLIGILAHEGVCQKCPVVIRSGDQDFYQLLQERKVIVNNGKLEICEKMLLKAWGLRPNQWVTFKSLVGDTDLKGIFGIGPVKAKKMILENDYTLPNDTDDPISEIANRNYRLMTIVTDKRDERLCSAAGAVVDTVFKSVVFSSRVVNSYSALKLIGSWEVPDIVGEFWGFLPMGEFK